MDSILFLRRQAALALILILGVTLPPATSGAAADGAEDLARLLAGANATLTAFLGEGEPADTVRNALRQAHGLLIFTNEGIDEDADGGIGGWRGLLFGRDTGGSWTGPAVYTVISGTFGRSPTDQVSQAMFIALTDVERLIAQRIRLGGSGISVARLAPGPLPAADLAAVTNAAKANEDPPQAFEGTVLAPDQYATNTLYGESITIREAVASTADIGDDVVNLRLRLDAETTAP